MRVTKLLPIAILVGICLVSSSCAHQARAEHPASSVATSSSPESVVDAQLAAYNQRDLEAFLSYYSDTAVLAKHPDQVTQTGKEQMRARYQRGFSNPNVRAEIIKRVVFGHYVIDHERLTAPPAKGSMEAVAVYEVKDGKIVRVTFLEP